MDLRGISPCETETLYGRESDRPMAMPQACARTVRSRHTGTQAPLISSEAVSGGIDIAIRGLANTYRADLEANVTLVSHDRTATPKGGVKRESSRHL